MVGVYVYTTGVYISFLFCLDAPWQVTNDSGPYIPSFSHQRLLPPYSILFFFFLCGISSADGFQSPPLFIPFLYCSVPNSQQLSLSWSIIQVHHAEEEAKPLAIVISKHSMQQSWFELIWMARAFECERLCIHMYKQILFYKTWHQSQTKCKEKGSTYWSIIENQKESSQ